MFEFLKSVFSESKPGDGSGSASRVLTLIHSCVASYCLIYVVRAHGLLPDAMAIAGLGAFATVHYAVNQLRGGLGK